MAIRIHQFDRSFEFLDRAESFLREDEVANSLILGVVTSIARQTHTYHRHQPLFALVEDHGNPVLAIAWTLPHKLLASTHIPVRDQALQQLVLKLDATRGMPEIVFGPDAVAHRLAQLWADHRSTRLQTGMEQCLYVLREVTWPDRLPTGSLRTALPQDRELIGRWIYAFQTEAVPAEATDMESALYIADRVLMDGNLFLWYASEKGTEGRPVSMAAKARPTQTGIAVNLVYTPPDLRQHGYATAGVAHLSQRLLDDGWQFCTLFTDRKNLTSNHIYSTIGYHPVADFTEYHLPAGS